MIELNSHEMINTSGGGISVVGGMLIIAGVILAIGIIDGYVRPLNCN